MIGLDKQKGFSLVTAIFLLVILASVGAFMVTIGGTQRTTTVAAIQGTRAFQAARSGIEWAVHSIINSADPVTTCSNTINPGSFTYAATGLNNFTVTLDCTSTPHTEAGPPDNVIIYSITAEARFSTYGSPDFVRRRITATISP
jgi:MSHA biogenesis protein MshP